jgi:hypothetical protein
MAAHSYWRLAVFAPTTSLISIDELEFYDSSGTSLLSTGGTASASSTQSANLPGNAFDSSGTTAWRSGVFPTADAPQWLAFHFTTPVDVAAIRTQIGSASTTIEAPTDFVIQRSDDGIAWVAASSEFASVPWNNGLPTFGGQFVWSFATTPPPAGYYANWRILIHNTQAGASNGGPIVAELAFRETLGGPTATTTLPQYAFWSDQRAGDYAGARVFDGDVTRRWVSDTLQGNWIGYNFPAPKFIAELAITAGATGLFGSAHEYERAPTVFDVQGSNDGITWVTVKSLTAQPWTGGNQTQVFAVQDAASSLLFFARGNIDYDQVKVKARTGPGPKFAMYAGTGKPTAGAAAIWDEDGNLANVDISGTGTNTTGSSTGTGGTGSGSSFTVNSSPTVSVNGTPVSFNDTTTVNGVPV